MAFIFISTRSFNDFSIFKASLRLYFQEPIRFLHKQISDLFVQFSNLTRFFSATQNSHLFWNFGVVIESLERMYHTSLKTYISLERFPF